MILKKISGIKLHIAVDTQGLPHALYITTANIIRQNKLPQSPQGTQRGVFMNYLVNRVISEEIDERETDPLTGNIIRME